MKKILTILIALVCMVSLTACTEKKHINESQIDNTLTKLGFYINDITESMEDSNILVAKTANNKKYQFEYYIFKNEKLAKTAYINNSKSFKYNTKYKGKEKNKENYEEYIQKTDTNYNRVERINNTLVYVSISLNHKNDVKDTLSEIGF